MSHSHYQLGHLFRLRIALTNEHGSWVFLFSPLLIGLFAGQSWSVGSVYLVVAALMAFLIRHPITLAVKVYSGRRPRRDLPAAYFWAGVYGLLGLGALVALVRLGFGSLLYVALPGALVFSWHLYLVSLRSERRQAGVEVAASGVLALTAPAAFWVGRGEYDPLGWWLWGLTWLQATASIVHAYLRLQQRTWRQVPDIPQRLQAGRSALFITAFNLLFVIAFSIVGALPTLLFLPYSVQFGETMWGVFHPAIGKRPTAIGLRQLAVSAAYTVLFILAWNV